MNRNLFNFFYIDRMSGVKNKFNNSILRKHPERIDRKVATAVDPLSRYNCSLKKMQIWRENSDSIRKRRFPDGRLRISSQSCFVNLSTDPGPILDSVPSNDPNSTGNKGILTVVTKSLLICRLPNSCRYCYSHGPAQHSENNFRDPSSEPIS